MGLWYMVLVKTMVFDGLWYYGIMVDVDQDYGFGFFGGLWSLVDYGLW